MAALAMQVAIAGAALAQDPFAACSEQFARKPDNYDSAYCFYEVTQQKSLWDDGARIFDRLIAAHPDNLWLPLAYGHVYRARDPQRAEALYRQSADGFRKIGHAEGEILARSNLRNFLFPKGRTDDAARETARVAELGRSVNDPLLKARAWTLEATQVQESGGDLSIAYTLLKRTEAVIFPNGPYRLKRSTLNSLGLVAFRLGRLDEALTAFTALDGLAKAEGELLAQASAQYNIFNTAAFKEDLLPSADARSRLMRLAERALATGVAAQNRDVTLKSHRALAELMLSDKTQRAAARAHVDACLALATQMKQPHDEAVCSWVNATLLREEGGRGAHEAELRAMDATTRAHSPVTDAYSARRRMRATWEANRRDKALADSLDAIGAMETLRSLQADSEGSAEQFSTWTSDYYWLSGRVLRDGRDADLELAFSITERMRARSLLDPLERSRRGSTGDNAAAAARRTVLENIATVQRRLMDPGLAGDARRTGLAELQDLELRERELQRQMGLALPSSQEAQTTGLRALQSTLRDNEALLSFQVALWNTYDGDFGGGAWLVALTRTQHSVHRLPDRKELTPIVPMLTGLIDRGDGLEEGPSVRLYDLLLADAIRQLPPQIERLIIVPDGPLHHLPFDALRAERGGPPLAARYEIVVAPSATLGRHWRERPAHAATQRTLTFADPVLSAGNAGTAATRSATLERGLRLGRLPYARQESRSIEQHLGLVDTLVGARASEKALKDSDLRRYDILHFAAHAIADETRPERSAVLLAPGAATEDGLLQTREISSLDLTDRTVVLSACQTAAGVVLSGEGVLSLARAFFTAGADTVIGSRWPIRDEDAAALFDGFYRHVGQGASLSEALKRAKADAIDGKRPARAWASLVLMGDGGLRPFPGGRTGPPSSVQGRAIGMGWATPILAAVSLTAMALAWMWGRRRRTG
jgi:CHAT domain-containing protein